FTVLVVDASEGEELGDGRFAVMTPATLRLAQNDFLDMATMYDVTELSTALKPWLLERMVADGTGVIYLDPDIEVFAPLDDIGELAHNHSMVVTPHLLGPMPRDGHLPSEIDILRTGVYNLGFIAIPSTSDHFLTWWKGRMRLDCIRAIDEGLFVDQRWIDL